MKKTYKYEIREIDTRNGETKRIGRTNSEKRARYLMVKGVYDGPRGGMYQAYYDGTRRRILYINGRKVPDDLAALF